MHPYMVEGSGKEARFRMGTAIPGESNPLPATEHRHLQLHLIGPIFEAGYDALHSQEAWVPAASYRFGRIADGYFAHGYYGHDRLRAETNGGALADTTQGLNDLARRQQSQQNDILHSDMTTPEILAHIESRRAAMHNLSYLALTKAGLSVEHFGITRRPAPLSRLEGSLVTRSSTGEAATLTVFKRACKTNWEESFPPPTETMGSTLKCPARAVLEDLVGASINIAHDRGYLFTKVDRFSLLPMS